MASTKTDTGNSLLDPMYTQILGGSGTWKTFGFISNEEYLPQLLWRNGIEVYDHMRRDPTVQGMLKAVKHPLLAADYDIEPASGQEFDQYVARFVKNELFNRNVKWRKFLRDALGKCDFGFALFEKTYEDTVFEGQFRKGIKELGWRKQWSIIRWATSTDEPGVTQQLLSGPVDIPEEKLINFVNDQEGDNDQGISLLRYVYGPYEMKRYLENTLMVAAQRSIGFPIVEYNPDASKNDQAKMENILKNWRNNERQYLFFPEGKFKWDWGKIETNIKTDLLPAIEHYQQEIDRSVLAQFLDLAGSRSGGGSGGSRALSEDHSQLFEKALEAVINEVIDGVNADLIQQLCDLNWSKMPNGYPKLVYSNIGDQNLAILSDYASKLGAYDLLTPDPDLEDWFREKGDMPKVPDDVRDNYNNRYTAQTKAQPLTQLGPGQDPNAPLPTGQKLENPPTGKQPPAGQQPGDQSNVVTRINQKKDSANKPMPNPDTWRKDVKATEELAAYRRELLARVMADDLAA
ncbi:MAG: DUF935 family protein [Patescibacteria group bacterium]|nr:DUF935 family protein [Patescibacteria group bacterium]